MIRRASPFGDSAEDQNYTNHVGDSSFDESTDATGQGDVHD